jgi:hypothetical protein
LTSVTDALGVVGVLTVTRAESPALVGPLTAVATFVNPTRTFASEQR